MVIEAYGLSFNRADRIHKIDLNYINLLKHSLLIDFVLEFFYRHADQLPGGQLICSEGPL